jgi:hypothetical protein
MTFGRDFTNAVEQKQIAQQEAGTLLGYIFRQDLGEHGGI